MKMYENVWKCMKHVWKMQYEKCGKDVQRHVQNLDWHLKSLLHHPCAVWKMYEKCMKMYENVWKCMKMYEACMKNAVWKMWKRCAEACAEPWLAFKKFAPPSTPDFSGEVGLNLAFGRLLPVEVIRLHVGDLHAVGWGHGGPWALATPVKAVRVGLKKEMFVDTNKERKVHMSKLGSE